LGDLGIGGLGKKTHLAQYHVLGLLASHNIRNYDVTSTRLNTSAQYGRKREALRDRSKRQHTHHPQGPEHRTTAVADERDKGSAEGAERAKNASPEVQFLVSSRQLRIVSPYFDNMFKQEYTETVPDPEDDLYHIQAEGSSDKALAVVLSTVHVQMKNIPRTIFPALFANIFLIADYYQTEKVLALYTTRWKYELKKTPHVSSYFEKAVLLMFLGMKLKDRDLFMSMASMVAKHSWGPIQFLDLPFPSGVQGMSTTRWIDMC
jgi:hypothetical protein